MRTTNETRREVMEMAWAWFRQVGGTFGEALTIAWRRLKMAVAPVVKVTYLASPISSPIDRRLGRVSYARPRSAQAGRAIARFGY